MQRNTSQKKVVMEYLREVKIHPTADIVYAEVKKRMPSISRSTVYRILSNFKDNGDIHEIKSDVSHYDAHLHNHAHFVCKKCGGVHDMFNFPDDFSFNTNTKIGKIDNYQVYFYGVCRDCASD